MKVTTQNLNDDMYFKIDEKILIEIKEKRIRVPKNKQMFYQCDICGGLSILHKVTFYRKLKKEVFLICVDCETAKTREIRNSSSVSLEKSRKTCFEKYGVDNPAKVEKFKTKMKDTCIEKYGVDCSLNSEESILKSKKTCLEKYGVEYSFQSENNRLKSKETLIQRYGVDNIGKDKSRVIEKEYRRKITCLEKYGVDNVIKSEKVRDNYKITCLKKLGATTPFSKGSVSRDALDVKTRATSFKHLIKKASESGFSLVEINEEGFYIKLHCNKCKKTWKWSLKPSLDPEVIVSLLPYCGEYSNRVSKGEKEIVDFIKSFYLGDIVENTRRIICPKELDIFLPEKKIAIEYDGIYWHSGEKGRDARILKQVLCKNKDIKLLSIFENEWKENRSFVERSLINLLGTKEEERNSGNWEIGIINKSTYEYFCIEYGYKEYRECSVIIGIFCSDILIQAIGFNKIKGENSFEMMSECSKIGVHLKDSEKLIIQYFESLVSPKTIITYCDSILDNVDVLQSLGFVKDINKLPCPYKYYKRGSTHLIDPNSKEFKQIVSSILIDENLNEQENMENNKYYRFYGREQSLFIKNL